MTMEKRQTSFSLREQWQILSHLFRFAKREWPMFLISIIFMVASSALTAYLPLVIQRFIDEVLAKDLGNWRLIFQIAGIYLGLLLVRLLVAYVKEYYFKVASEKTVAHLRNHLYAKLSTLSMDFFSKVPNGSIVSRITNDTETIKEFWNVFLTFADGLLNATAIMIGMFSLSSQLTWVFVAFIPLVIFQMYVFQKASTVIYGRMRQALSTLNARLSESIMGMWLIQQFNQTERMKKAFDEVNQTYVKARLTMFRLNALMLMPAMSLMEKISLVIILLIFGYQILTGGTIVVGVVYAFVAYSRSFFAPIGHMLDSLSIYQDGLVAASRGMQFLRVDLTAPVSSPQAQPLAIEGNVVLEDVSFSYDGDQWALKEIDLEAPAGQMIGIVGHTGSGKSTIINLLMRFYDYQKGSIRIDDREIRDITMESLRDQVGIVLQDPFMFYGNIMENIRLHGDYTDREVVEAAKFAQADPFIQRLPQGYQQFVSEGGASLSAGQRQLLSIARTVLRDPKILILDEATANIDSETELYIQESLARIRKDRTLIVIAHRLSTIKDADYIYVLSNGDVIESGSHDQLIEKEGSYYDMYRLQSLEETGS